MQTQLNTLEDRINRMTQRAGPYEEANPPPRPRRVLPATFGGLRGGAQIFVKTLSGKTITINDINITDSVGELARNVCRRLGLPPDADFYFIFGGHMLRDENLDLWQLQHSHRQHGLHGHAPARRGQSGPFLQTNTIKTRAFKT